MNHSTLAERGRPTVIDYSNRHADQDTNNTVVRRFALQAQVGVEELRHHLRRSAR
jgi:hypothetical protein